MTNKEACLILDEFERYHRGDISDEQEEAFTLASRLLSCIPDEIEGDYDTLDTYDLMILFEALMSKRLEATRIFTQEYAEDYLTRLDKIMHYMKYHFLGESDLLN